MVYIVNIMKLIKCQIKIPKNNLSLFILIFFYFKFSF